MSIINKPNEFVAATEANASEVNANFDTIYDDYNGNITAANLATDSVTAAKIASDAVTTAKIQDDAVTVAKVAATMGGGTAGTGAWDSWSPTLGGVTEGNGTKSAKYIQIGKTVFWKLSFIFGSTSDVTSDVTMTLPVTSVAVAATGENLIGMGQLHDASGGPLKAACQVRHASTTTAGLKSWRADGTFLTEAAVNATNPFDWTNGDAINIQGFYEAA